MRIIVFILRIILVIIMVPFLIVPAICIWGTILLDHVDNEPVNIMKHMNLINKGYNNES